MTSLTLERLDEILERARTVRVAVVGDLMLDVYLTGGVSRISPEAPVPVVTVVEERTALGGAANVAANVAALGADCHLIGTVGTDPAGEQVRSAVESLGTGNVHARLVARADRPTTTKTRVVARHQQVVRFDREDERDLPLDCTDELCGVVASAIAESDVVVLEDYNKGVLTPAVIRTALTEAEAAGIPVVVDPKFRHIFEYRGATVMKPNAFELTSALGEPLRAADDEWLEGARRRFGCEHLLVTLGEDGMALCSAKEGTFRVATTARQVFDVSGAGDTVAACLGVALAAGATMREAAIMANFAAGVEVAKHGVATVSPEELRLAAEDARRRIST